MKAQMMVSTVQYVCRGKLCFTNASEKLSRINPRLWICEEGDNGVVNVWAKVLLP